MTSEAIRDGKSSADRSTFSNMSNDNTSQESSVYLYWASGSLPCWRTQIVLNEKQVIGYKSQMISLDQNEHKTKPLIIHNPRGQVPSLRIGSIVLNESLAICLYLENTLKNQGTILLPADPRLHAKVLQYIFDSAQLQKLGNEDLIYPIWQTSIERHNIDTLKKRKEALINELIRWNNRFKEQNQQLPFAIGKQFTLADVFLFPPLALFVHCGYPLHLHERLYFYYEHLLHRPSIHNSFPSHWSTTSDLLSDCTILIEKMINNE